MRFSSFVAFLILVCAPNWALAQVKVQSISDDLWRDSVFQGYVHNQKVPYPAWHGAFNALEKERASFGSGLLEVIRTGNRVQRFSNDWGIGVTSNASVRTAGFVYFADNNRTAHLGGIRIADTGVREAGILFQCLHKDLPEMFARCFK